VENSKAKKRLLGIRVLTKSDLALELGAEVKGLAKINVHY
jgi:hypothetical protein